MRSIDDAIERAIALRDDARPEEARAALEGLLAEHEGHARLRYQLAWTCDVLGAESDAVPHYERALELGLEGEDRLGAFLGLGSTYRTLGRYDDAVRTLTLAREAFPAARELDAFLAMAHHNRGEHGRAMELLLQLVADTSEHAGVRQYRRAIAFYADRLDEVFR